MQGYISLGWRHGKQVSTFGCDVNSCEGLKVEWSFLYPIRSGRNSFHHSRLKNEMN